MSETTPTPPVTQADLRNMLDQVRDLMETPVKQRKIVEVWERLWNEELPNLAIQLEEMIAVMDESPTFEITPENSPVMAEMFQMFVKTMDVMSADRAPNPNIVALHYLRRIEGKIDDIDERLRKEGI